MGADSISETLQAELQQRLANQDVTLYESLQRSLSLELMYLYPHPERIVTNSQEWLTGLVTSQTGQQSPKVTVSTQKMFAMQQKIQQLNFEFAQ